MSDKVIRKPRFQKSNMVGTVKDCQKLYEEVRQWTRCEENDTSLLKQIVYGMGWSVSDLAYHGWDGDNLKREQEDLYAVMSAVEYLQNVLEDVLGIEVTEYSDYLKNDECGRFKLIDTYKENN